MVQLFCGKVLQGWQMSELIRFLWDFFMSEKIQEDIKKGTFIMFFMATLYIYFHPLPFGCTPHKRTWSMSPYHFWKGSKQIFNTNHHTLLLILACCCYWHPAATPPMQILCATFVKLKNRIARIVYMQYCYSNFFFIEDVENASIDRDGFRQKNEAIEEMLQFLHLKNLHIWLDLEGQLISQIRQIKAKTIKHF